MANNEAILNAIEDLESQEAPNIKRTAEKYGLERTTLAKRWKGQTTSMADHVSTVRQCLTNSQEKALVQLINRLTECRLPPTSSIVKNLAIEIRGKDIGKNWIASFVHRHQDVLLSLHLKTMDNKRIKGEFPNSYKLFYELV